MPGMISPEGVESLRQAQGEGFDRLFISTMTFHHQGAIRMADEAIREAGDVRLRLMSHAIRHSQRGEIDLMSGKQGLAAVAAATANLTKRAGETLSDAGHKQH